jgi:UDP-glucuronate 4-epimerase
MKILITGCAGFIGMHLSKKLLQKHEVIGLDNINSYYDTKLKKDRLKILKKNKKFSFFKTNIINFRKLSYIFKKTKPSIVIHLASEVGVRNSTLRPRSYVNTNILGFLNILESCKNTKVNKLFYASSSSVYGNNKKKFSENLRTDNPLSVYAASKKGAEILAATYSYLYDLPTIGLRFFTVYGPYGRPDMAIFKFTESIFQKKAITVYGDGNLERDFTYIDDVVSHIDKIINKKFLKNEILNIGNTIPVKVIKLISILEEAIGIKARVNLIKTPKTEVHKTCANISKLKKYSSLKNSTSIKKGIYNFINWYKNYKQKRNKTC